MISLVYSWILVMWIYLRVGCHFWRWRMQLWLIQLHLIESTFTSMKQTLLFIRHGQTTWNVEHKLPGQLPGVALNDKGRKQAAYLADALSAIPISSIISSPLERAYDTAQIIAQGRGLSIQLEPGLMDTNIGRWAGENYEQLSKNDPDWKAYVQDPTVAPEGIETFPQVQQRSLAAIERWRAREDVGMYLAFVTHADVVKLLVAHYTGLEAKRAGTLFIDNASVSLVEINTEDIHAVRVVAVGWNPHPGWLKPTILDKQKDDIPIQEGEQKA
ncbi:MAG: histidine phosphatase family protein [Ktedonobacteraceae bacterium]